MNSGARRPVVMQAVDELTGAPQGRLDEAGGNGELDGPNSAPLPRIMHARYSSSSSSYGTAALSRLSHPHSLQCKLCTCTQSVGACRRRMPGVGGRVGVQEPRVHVMLGCRRLLLPEGRRLQEVCTPAAPSNRPHPV